MIKTISTWQFSVYIALLVLSVGVTYGALTIRIGNLEDCSAISKKDHDIVLVIGSRLESIIEDLKEIKSDLKELKAKR
jgi:hypothetical protein